MNRKKIIILSAVILLILALGLGIYAFTSMHHADHAIEMDGRGHHDGPIHHGEKGSHSGKGKLGTHHMGWFFLMKLIPFVIVAAIVWGVYWLFTRKYAIVRKPSSPPPVGSSVVTPAESLVDATQESPDKTPAGSSLEAPEESSVATSEEPASPVTDDLNHGENPENDKK